MSGEDDNRGYSTEPKLDLKPRILQKSIENELGAQILRNDNSSS